MKGGQASVPHGVTHTQEDDAHFLGAVFSNVPVHGGNKFIRPSAGGGGLFDPLERDPAMVVEDVIDDYVSLEGARRDYGVVIDPIDPELDDFRVDEGATKALRDELRAEQSSWFDVPAEDVAMKLQKGEIDRHTAIRRHGVICDWDTNTLLPRSTEQFREAAKRRSFDSRS
jgi:N-methylhydantoinase B